MQQCPTPADTPQAFGTLDWYARTLAAIDAGYGALRAARDALPANDSADSIGRVAYLRLVLDDALRHLEGARHAVAPKCKVAQWALNEC